MLAIVGSEVARGQDDADLEEVPGEFKCRPGSDGLFAHPEYCDRYFECQSGQVIKRKICADGLGFDPEKSPEEDPCDHLHNIKDRCKTRSKFQKPQPGDSYCPRQNGVYPSPDPSECDTFYSCLNGVGSLQQCADGLHFDPDIGTCVWARESSRKGCLSALKRAQQAEAATKKPDGEKEGESLPNGFKCPGGKLGIHPALPHPDSCRLYYVCLNGVTPNEAGCVSGLVFNKETSKCDNPQNVPGCEDTYVKQSAPRPQPKQLHKSQTPAKPIKHSRPEDHDSTEDLTKLLTILSNPKLKTFLKPEIADVLESVNGEQSDDEEDEEEIPGPKIGHGRKRKKRPHHVQETQPEETVRPLSDPEEDIGSSPPLSNRRNVFTSKLIPRVRPVGNPENVRLIESSPEEPFLPTIQPTTIEVFTERSTATATTTTTTTTAFTFPPTSENISPEVPRSAQVNRNRFPRPPGSKPSLGQRPQLVQRHRKPVEVSSESPILREVTPPAVQDSTLPAANEEIIKTLLASAVDPDLTKPEMQENL